MRQYFIFVFYAIIQIKCDIVQANESATSESLSNIASMEKCTFMFCSCDDFLNSSGVYCEGPGENYISELRFLDYEFLAEGMLQGLRVDFLLLDDPKISVPENFLEGINFLHRITVKQSNITVKYVLILYLLDVGG